MGPMSVDVSNLTPDDAATAVASYARRFRAVLTEFDDDEQPDDLVRRPDAQGRSAVDHADVAGRAIAWLGDALRTTLVTDGPTLPADVLGGDGPGRPEGAGPATPTVAGTLDLLAIECDAVAGAIRRTSIEQWNRTATVGTKEVTALDLAREAVRRGSDSLRAAQAAVDAARRG